MAKITFVRAYQVKAADGPAYEEGQSVECSDESAAHFIGKGVAIAAGKRRNKPLIDDNGGKPDESPSMNSPYLAALEIPESAIAELAKQGITNADQLSAFAKENDLTQLPGIGKATAKQIAAKLDES